MGVYLRATFQVSSIILTSFRRGNFIPPSPHTPKNEPLKSPPRLGLKHQKVDNRSWHINVFSHTKNINILAHTETRVYTILE